MTRKTTFRYMNHDFLVGIFEWNISSTKLIIYQSFNNGNTKIKQVNNMIGLYLNSRLSPLDIPSHPV